MAMRAVVGGPKHQSPMLVSSGIDAIVINPTWYVPESIVVKEIEPRLEREPDYLESNEMHWDGERLLQAPGAKNSLGRIKFDFPSPFAVYLHDTPAHSYFARAVRQLSHGCIRLEKPRELALKLLAGDDKWTEEHLKKAIDSGTTERIAVPAGPQVALVYWTAFVDEDGTLEFRNDVYGRDARLETALGGTPVATRGVVRLAARHGTQQAAAP
jgi:murein L,D-transpeptidase YcbB/YkuD